MADSAKIGQPEVNLGIIPGFGGTQRLSRLVGPGVARELIYTGDHVDAQEALRIGLVNKVVPLDKLMDTVMELARKIAAKGPAAVRLAKNVISRGLDSSLDAGNSLEIEAFCVCFASGEPKEGMTAFLEKRTPNWK
jgi:enoyl-CoA hydratase